MIEQAKFTDSFLGEAFGKQIKAFKNQREKQIKAIEYVKQLAESNALINASPSFLKQK